MNSLNKSQKEITFDIEVITMSILDTLTNIQYMDKIKATRLNLYITQLSILNEELNPH